MARIWLAVTIFAAAQRELFLVRAPQDKLRPGSAARSATAGAFVATAQSIVAPPRAFPTGTGQLQTPVGGGPGVGFTEALHGRPWYLRSAALRGSSSAGWCIGGVAAVAAGAAACNMATRASSLTKGMCWLLAQILEGS